MVTDIRVLDADHWREIRDIRLRSLADAPEAFTSTLERESAYDETKWRDLASSGRWFVADDEGPVGVAVGVPDRSGDPSRHELVGMWVASSHRRSGVARRLVDAVTVWAASEGADTLSLGVREDNVEALAAYLRMGLEPSGETVPEVGRPTKAIIVLERAVGPSTKFPSG
ncbi:MAG TPA: GNAT family N-acetyltransferase [Acidimicrobiales bacterium]|jgi:GNAT superfamily N-acetyltransferase|nr:GNAT family N-acetyltransferase [Acidimicrobiales bacterium]